MKWRCILFREGKGEVSLSGKASLGRRDLIWDLKEETLIRLEQKRGGGGPRPREQERWEMTMHIYALKEGPDGQSIGNEGSRCGQRRRGLCRADLSSSQEWWGAMGDSKLGKEGRCMITLHAAWRVGWKGPSWECTAVLQAGVRNLSKALDDGDGHGYPEWAIGIFRRYNPQDLSEIRTKWGDLSRWYLGCWLCFWMDRMSMAMKEFTGFRPSLREQWWAYLGKRCNTAANSSRSGYLGSNPHSHCLTGW